MESSLEIKSSRSSIVKGRLADGQRALFIDDVIVSTDSDLDLFKRLCPDVAGKRILMGGLGLGNDVLWCLDQGCSLIRVIEIHPEVVDLFLRRLPPEHDSRLIIHIGDFFLYPRNGYDLIVDSTHHYVIHAAEQRP